MSVSVWQPDSSSTRFQTYLFPLPCLFHALCNTNTLRMTDTVAAFHGTETGIKWLTPSTDCTTPDLNTADRKEKLDITNY